MSPRCGCGICRVSRELQSSTPNLDALGRGVDAMLESWCDSDMRLGHIMHALKDQIEAGVVLPDAVIAAFDLAARGTAYAREGSC